MTTRGVYAILIRAHPDDHRPTSYMGQRRGNLDGSGYPGQWELFGGRTLDGETDEQCIKRCVLEKTGLEVVVLGVVSLNLVVPSGVITAEKDEAQAYYCELVGGVEKPFPTETHLSARWVPLEDIFSGKVRIITNPTSKGYLGRMAKMTLAGFEAHKSAVES